MNAEATAIITNDPLPKRDQRVVTQPDPNATPMQMLAIMTQRGVSMADLKDLVTLAKDWEANEARKAYVNAMSAFKAEPISILKSKGVNIPGGAQFKHATLADVVDGVVATLAKHGLSHKWITDQQDRAISVTCVITHKLGHSESATLVAPPDDSGKKNGIQQIASTVTYLERYTLMAVCGLAAKDMDNDGNGAPGKEKPKAPDGYDNWSMDMDAKAEDGKAAHLDAWKKSPEKFRNYATRYDLDWWERSKQKAAKAGA